ncbi:MAG: SDR family oxidoreductase [Sphingomonadales bacterium]|nr:MAG: SDR family oxidoreductase [Sphingomonadales bacterium]
MAHELEGKVAIVTGGANGIGAATAELFVEEGARVLIADLDAERGEAIAARLGDKARFRRTDVADRAEIQALVDQAIADFGDLDIMFNNAGFSGNFHNRYLNDPLEDFDRVLQVNLAGVMHGSQIAARHMVKQGKGSIINTTSIAAVTAGYAVLTYRAAKAGVLNFTKSLAIDLGEYGIRVNGIAPGHIPTGMNPFFQKGLAPERQAKLDELMTATMQFNQPLKRIASGRDVAQMAMFLGSDRSLYVTGQVIAVDGGVTAGDPINLNGMCAEARRQFLEEEE